VIDWPVAGSNFFMGVAALALVAAPLVGHHGGWRRLPRPLAVVFLVTFLASLGVLIFSWRTIIGGTAAALFGHTALIVSVAAMAEFGRLAGRFIADRLAGALVALGVGVMLIAGAFAAGPLTGDLSATASLWLLVANPLVAITSAAGIDLLHLDAIYRTSPLAHRGMALPAWTTACAVYAFSGLAAHGVSRLRPWSLNR
jgi:hypothetical protein